MHNGDVFETTWAVEAPGGTGLYAATRGMYTLRHLSLLLNSDLQNFLCPLRFKLVHVREHIGYTTYEKVRWRN